MSLTLNAQFGVFKLNPTSEAASIAIAVETTLWRREEPNLRAAIRDFNEEYLRRRSYYAPTVIDGGAVINLVDTAIARVNQLLIDNRNLRFFYPFKQRDNERKLDQILIQLTSHFNELSGLRMDTIYGERMMLNQEVEIAMEAVNRKLDGIESDIENSTVLSRLLGL